MAVDIGTGTLVIVPTLSTSDSDAQVRDVRFTGPTYDFADSTVQSTATAKTFIRGDVYDPGTVEFDIAFDPSATFNWTATATTITVKWAGSTTSSDWWTATGFFTGATFNAPYQGNEVMTGTMTFKLTGVLTT